MNTATTSNEIQTPKSSDGYQVGQSASDLVGFYGVAPCDQPAAAAQGAITDESGGTANTATGIVTLTGTYNSAILANAIATLAAQGNAIRAALVEVGLIKGSA
jgi:hypothetical protein